MVLQKSKIRFFLILLTVVSTINISCNRDKFHPVPDVYVDFYIDLISDPEFFDLTTLTGSVLISSETNNWGSKAAGYDNNGIIVYHATNDPGYEYFACDRTCPHCLVTNAESVAVNLDFTTAVCPRCSTLYMLPSFGTPYSGPGRYPLKNYRAQLSGQFLHVWNSRY